MYHPLLSTFVCVADCGSFNKASEQLFISPPSVMKQINNLEMHLGLTLVQRTNQGILLTAAGQVIYRYAQRFFVESEHAILEAEQAEARQNATLSIGSSLLNPCKPFVDLWYQINQSFPDYTLQIVPFEDDHKGILSEISALGTKFDLLAGVCDSALWLDRCQFLPLGSYQHCVAVSREHPLAARSRLTLSDLEGQTLMMVKEGDSLAVDAIRAEVRRYPGIRIEDTPQFYDIEVFNRCQATLSVMLTIECWRDVHPALVTIPMDWDHPIPYGLLYSMKPRPQVRKVIAAVSAITSGV